MDFSELPYAEWLEQGVAEILQNNPSKIALVAQMPDGAVMTGYYNADATDKAVFAHNIYADSILDLIISNIDVIKEAINEMDEEDAEQDGESFDG